MKRFQFSLESALQYRRLQAERAEAALAEVVREQEHWVFQTRQIDEQELRTRHDAVVLGRDGIVKLESQDVFLRRLSKVRHQLLLRQRDCTQRLAAQRQAVMEARRAVKTLENLREKSHAEWRAAEARELDELAADSYLARWSRELAPGAEQNEQPDLSS